MTFSILRVLAIFTDFAIGYRWPESESGAHLLAGISLVRNGPIRNDLFYFKSFGHFDGTFAIGYRWPWIRIRSPFFGRGFIGQEWTNQKWVFFILRLWPFWLNLAIGYRGPWIRIRSPFFWPRFHWSGTGQSEMTFSIVRVLAILIEVSYRLSMALNPESGAHFFGRDFIGQERANQKWAFLF